MTNTRILAFCQDVPEADRLASYETIAAATHISLMGNSHPYLRRLGFPAHDTVVYSSPWLIVAFPGLPDATAIEDFFTGINQPEAAPPASEEDDFSSNDSALTRVTTASIRARLKEKIASHHQARTAPTKASKERTLP
ncbi:hypothetical protein V3M89_04495 [Trueperella pyogenes]|uniref:hypothetical protein n=1 Tax=Trueperella pyogenes TaxID=1661 RepID=UPI00345D5EDD